MGAGQSGAEPQDSATARLFVALELPAGVRADLRAWAAQAAAADAALRVVPAASLHLTLHFLGLRPQADVPALGEALAQAGAAHPGPVALRLGGALWLAPKRPHVLSCAVAGAGDALATLHRRLARSLAAATPGWRPQSRAFTPHVTVARVRRGARPRRGAEPPAPEGRCAAPAMVLLRSHLDPGGARYEQVHRVALPF